MNFYKISEAHRNNIKNLLGNTHVNNVTFKEMAQYLNSLDQLELILPVEPKANLDALKKKTGNLKK